MRCALSFDTEKSFFEQELSAWGEMQSLKEEPAYKESDIKDAADREFFRGCKYMADEVYDSIAAITEDDEVSEEMEDKFEYIEECIQGELVEVLFSILDGQEDDECE